MIFSMMRLITILTIGALTLSGVANAQQQRPPQQQPGEQQQQQPVRDAVDELDGVGIGAIFGEPTGLSVKAWIDRYNAIDGALAVSMDGDTNFHAHVSYLRHEYDVFPVDRGSLPLYYGIGGRFKAESGDTDRVGIRFPVGIAYHFVDLPLEAFGEVAPIFDLTPDTSVRLNAAVGLRFYFR